MPDSIVHAVGAGLGASAPLLHLAAGFSSRRPLRGAFDSAAHHHGEPADRFVPAEAPPSALLLPKLESGPQSISLDRKLGEGTFGQVFSATCVEADGSTSERAVKRFIFSSGRKDEGVPETALRELATLKSLGSACKHVCSIVSVMSITIT